MSMLDIWTCPKCGEELHDLGPEDDEVTYHGGQKTSTEWGPGAEWSYTVTCPECGHEEDVCDGYP